MRIRLGRRPVTQPETSGVPSPFDGYTRVVLLQEELDVNTTPARIEDRSCNRF
jgi:hypothetical protein